MQSVPGPAKPAPLPQHVLNSGGRKRSTILISGIIFLSIWLSSRFVNDLWHRPDYQSNLSFHCAGLTPIPSPEYHIRQANLAKTLHTLNASAYIAEPSANSQFFANFSTAQWFLSERPLLLILMPSFDTVNGDVKAKLTILTPKVKSYHE